MFKEGTIMILTVITALICFTAGIICFSPYFRRVPLLRPLAFLIIFEGVSSVVSYIFSELYPTSGFPTYFNSIGTIIILIYFLFVMFMTRNKSKHKKD